MPTVSFTSADLRKSLHLGQAEERPCALCPDTIRAGKEHIALEYDQGGVYRLWSVCLACACRAVIARLFSDLSGYTDRQLFMEQSRRCWSAPDTGPGLPKGEKSCPACGSGKEGRE